IVVGDGPIIALEAACTLREPPIFMRPPSDDVVF
nr:hypothetical protein [Tanacetum cinerariifolium]